VDPAGIAVWDISIQPDGAGLPAGSGTPAEGAQIYAAKCASCHGPDGKGSATSPTPLVGGGPITDISASMKTIANYGHMRPPFLTMFDERCRGSSQ
jgi:cytochrome c